MHPAMGSSACAGHSIALKKGEIGQHKQSSKGQQEHRQNPLEGGIEFLLLGRRGGAGRNQPQHLDSDVLAAARCQSQSKQVVSGGFQRETGSGHRFLDFQLRNMSPKAAGAKQQRVVHRKRVLLDVDLHLGRLTQEAGWHKSVGMVEGFLRRNQVAAQQRL